MWRLHALRPAPQAPRAACRASALRRSAFLPGGAVLAAVRPGAAPRRVASGAVAQFADDADLELARFGEHSFRGDVASRYLGKYGETAALLATSAWTANKSDIVAAALMDWAKDNGASVYCHWFQPMGARPTGGCAVQRARWRAGAHGRRRAAPACAARHPNLTFCVRSTAGASGFRHGLTGQLYNTMIEFDGNNVPRWKARGPATARGTSAA
jgi:hypothetical protein